MNLDDVPRIPSTKLYTTHTCIEGHACRIILHEKEIEYRVEYVDDEQNYEKLDQMNPYGESPVLIDRGDRPLFGGHVISEYLDDRLPHPPMMPPDPFSRGQVRLHLYHFRRDWIGKLKELDRKKQKPSNALRRSILRGIVGYTRYLDEEEFLVGNEFTLADCFFVALLWYLEQLKVKIPEEARGLHIYQRRMFNRESFKQSNEQTETNMYTYQL